jgi:hypothetical protein
VCVCVYFFIHISQISNIIFLNYTLVNEISGVLSEMFKVIEPQTTTLSAHIELVKLEMYCDILGFPGNATVEWCVIVVSTIMKQASIQQCNGDVSMEELQVNDQLGWKTQRYRTHRLCSGHD